MPNINPNPVEIPWEVNDKESVLKFIEDLEGNYGEVENVIKENKFELIVDEHPKEKGYLVLAEVVNALYVGFTPDIEVLVEDLQRWKSELTIAAFIATRKSRYRIVQYLGQTTGEFFSLNWYPLTRKQEFIAYFKLEAYISDIDLVYFKSNVEGKSKKLNRQTRRRDDGD